MLLNSRSSVSPANLSGRILDTVPFVFVDLRIAKQHCGRTQKLINKELYVCARESWKVKTTNSFVVFLMDLHECVIVFCELVFLVVSPVVAADSEIYCSLCQ